MNRKRPHCGGCQNACCLKIEDLSVRFGSETVLENASMDADPTLAVSQDSDPKTVAVTYYTGLSREPNTVTVNIGE